MKKNTIKSLFFVCTSSVILGCAVGNAPSENPPRLMNTVFQQGWGGSGTENIAWDSPSAFGPVPESLQVTGDAYCKKGGFERAVGYHPNALDLDGKPIPGGGFFCSNSKNQ